MRGSMLVNVHHQALKQHRAIAVATTPEENVSWILFLCFVLNVTVDVVVLLEQKATFKHRNYRLVLCFTQTQRNLKFVAPEVFARCEKLAVERKTTL